MGLFVALRAAAIAVVVAVPASAFAQSPDFWSGAYLGAQGGFAQPSFVATGTLTYGSFSGSVSKPYSGPTAHEAGVYTGYRWQTPQGIVFGGEADINWANLSATSAPLLSIGACPWLACANLGSVHTNVDWYGTVRGTLGQAIGQLYLYGTGGLAYGNVSSATSSNVVVLGSEIFSDSAHHSGVRVGWTAGAGAAIAINERVSVKLEYLHVDLGEKEIFRWSGKVGSKQLTKSVMDDVKFGTVRLGLTVRFP